jgi:glycerate kinase
MMQGDPLMSDSPQKKNLLICTDSFKDYKSSVAIAEQLKQDLHQLGAPLHIETLPLADGGEGTIAVLAQNKKLPIKYADVLDPMGRTVSAAWLFEPSTKTAYIGMAEASGIELLKKEERNCFYTSTYGTGQIMREALENGAENLHLFVGGSATCDMGIGMCAALGHGFYIGDKKLDIPIGKDLQEITRIEKNKDLPPFRLTVYTDVDNPLFGKEGAAYTYGPQKGASDTQIQQLDLGLQNIHQLIKEKSNIDVNFPKSGAAGGIAAGARYFLDGEVKMGTHFLFDLLKVEEAVQVADVVITGEGKLDHQTFSGKLVNHICSLAREKYTLVLCGKNDLKKEEYNQLHIDAVIALKDLAKKDHDKEQIVDTLYLVAPMVVELIS